MSKGFSNYLHKGWAVTLVVSLLVMVASVLIILLFNNKLMPNKSLTKLLWLVLCVSGVTLIDSIGIKTMHNFVIVPTSVWLVYGLLGGLPLNIVAIVFIALTVVSFTCSGIYKHVKGISA